MSSDTPTLESSYHDFRPEFLCRAFSNSKQVLKLSHDCEDFLASMHDTTSPIPFLISQSFLIYGRIPKEHPGVSPVGVVKYDVKLISAARAMAETPYCISPVK